MSVNLEASLLAVEIAAIKFVFFFHDGRQNGILINNMGQEAGFAEQAHTADWELRVWGPDLAALLEQAARGMYRLTGARLKEGPWMRRKIEISFTEPESLLVDFLSDLLFRLESENLVFEQFDLVIEGNRLFANLSGAPLASLDKEIKAVTYHNLTVRKTERGLEANVVFDV